MQFRWNHTQGAPDYDRETGFGFVTGAVYTADAALHIPETNSGFLPLWWYAGTPISDIRQSEYGLQATAAEALRTEDAADRRAAVSRALTEAGCTVLALAAENRSLEEVFLALTEKAPEPQAPAEGEGN